MAKIKLEYETNLDPLQKAGQQVHQINTEAVQLGNTMTNSFKKAAESSDKFDSSLKHTANDAKKLSNEIDKNANSIKKASAQAETFGSKLSAIATGFIAGQVITSGLSKIGAAFSHAIDLQKEFEKSIQNLSAITGASGTDLQFYSDQALKLGITVKGGAVATVEAFKLIGSAKPELLANKEALVEVTEAAILLSQATGLELPDAATRLTDAMNQFGAASDQAGLFVDTLAAGAKFGAAEVPQITEALLKFGVAAKSSNINIVESTSAIELLAEKGLKGAEAGTALRNVFAKLSATKVLPREAKKELEDAGVNLKTLSDTTIPLQERLQELSKIQNNANALTRVFGLENKNAAQSILQNLPRLQELTKQIGEQGLGTAAEQAAKNMDTLDQALLETSNQYDNMILSMTSGDFGNILKGFVKSANDELKALAAQISNVGTLLTKGFGALQDKAGEDFIQKIATSIAPEQRLAAAKKLNDEIQFINKELQEGLIELTDEEKAQSLEQIKTKSQLVNAILALDKKQAVESTEIIVTGEQTTTEETAKELDKRIKLQEDFAKALLDLRKRIQAAQLEQAAPVEKINLQKQFAQEELDLYQQQFVKIGKLTNANFKLNLEQEQQFAFLRNAINIKAAEELIKIEVDKQNKLAQARLNASKATAENLALEEQNLISGVGLSGRPIDLTEADFERVKQKQIFDIQSEYAIKKLELKQKSLAAELAVAEKAADGELALLQGKDDEESNAKKKQIIDNLSLVEQKYALEGEAAQDATAKIINDIQKQREDLDSKNAFDLAKFLGVNADNIRNIQLAMSKIAEAITVTLDQQIVSYDKVIEESQKRQEQIDGEIEDLESKLETEKNIGDEGLANNQQRILDDIAAKQQAKELEKELELKAIEERKKVQKQKLLLDSIIQGSNMVTAATEIYAKAAASTGPASVPIAIAAIAAMLTAFIAQKAAALKAINEGNGFKDGVIDLEGPGTETSDSINARLSKGESVITARVTKKRKSLLQALASDDDSIVKKALLEELKGTGISIDASLPKELANKKESIRSIESKLMFQQDNSKMEKELIEIKSKLQIQINSNKNKTYLDQNGNLVKKFGSHTSIIKKRGKL